MPKVIPPEDITVAIFCALTIESVAVRHSFDERFESHPIVTTTQHNYVYNYGRIGDHKVVLARPHQMGPVQAAQCAENVAQQFPNVRFALMIGIGGGIPSPKIDIRLGDVAVSIPKSNHPGVIQYDYGKYEADGHFVLKGSLNKPPGILISADGSLEEDEEMGQSQFWEFLQTITSKKGYSRPTSPDILFDSAFKHLDGEGCNACYSSIDKEFEMRPQRDEEIKVHRGLILSGGGVVKNTVDRSDLRRGDDQAICFEMEAAGIMDQIPCLVIRGICDYADTHKNDEWHRYAAGVAAAYGKAILTKIRFEEMKVTVSMKDLMKSLERDIQEVGQDIRDLRHRVEAKQQSLEKTNILSWLQKVNWSHELSKHLQHRAPGTGQWLLDSPEFRKWLNEPGDSLLCYGPPGAGKTVMASIVVDNLQSEFRLNTSNNQGTQSAVIFVFCAFENRGRQNTIHILLSLLQQLIEQLPSIPDIVQDLHRNTSNGQLESIRKMDIVQSLIVAARLFSRVLLVIDALDECDEASDLLSGILNLQTKANVNLFATSRPEDRTRNFFHDHQLLYIHASEEDVGIYLNSRISTHRVIKDTRNDFSDELKNNLEKEIAARIARFHMDSVMEMTSPRGIFNTIRTLPHRPDAYKEIYSKTMARICNQSSTYRSLAKSTFEWVLCAETPLKMAELREAIAIRLGSSSLDELDFHSTDAIVEACRGLILVDPDQQIHFLHHTTREYLDSNFTVLSTMTDIESLDTESLDSRTLVHKYIALACLTYLSFTVFESGNVPKSYAFYTYAASYWGYHFRRCELCISTLVENPITIGFVHDRLKIKACAKKTKDPDSPSYHTLAEDTTALHLAAYFGIEALAAFLSHDIAVNDIDSDKRTPLSYASQYGHAAATMTLLQAGAEVDTEDERGWTPLGYAASRGHDTIVRILLENGAGMDVEEYENKPPTLVLAAQGGHTKAVQELYDWMPNAHPQRTIDQALLKAASNGFECTAESLIHKGADIHTPESDGNTALHVAARQGYHRVVRCLLRNGFKVDLTNDDNLTALMEAIHRSDWDCVDIKAVQVLLDNGASIEPENDYGEGPLVSAARFGNMELVQLLLDREAGRDAATLSRASFEAALNHKHELALLILRHLAQMKVGEVSIRSYETPFHMFETLSEGPPPAEPGSAAKVSFNLDGKIPKPWTMFQEDVGYHTIKNASHSLFQHHDPLLKQLEEPDTDENFIINSNDFRIPPDSILERSCHSKEGDSIYRWDCYLDEIPIWHVAISYGYPAIGLLLREGHDPDDLFFPPLTNSELGGSWSSTRTLHQWWITRRCPEASNDSAPKIHSTREEITRHTDNRMEFDPSDTDWIADLHQRTGSSQALTPIPCCVRRGLWFTDKLSACWDSTLDWSRHKGYDRTWWIAPGEPLSPQQDI
ncbi:hypothetical protein FSARC_9498 [Fusarium sarcochroum]|uniref:NACHT domain-containing protein n=1 Tax=Fusarium sarcochroum TaxID=1208366 RepID=A0A8H4TQW1_9HYPO|nr:hypothetical protein FSARC_9498 [Fusarium sarcochroum]